MSDPQPVRLKRRPPRAAPIQPDKPGTGDGPQGAPEGPAEDVAQAAVDKQREQTETALENTRDGYGG